MMLDQCLTVHIMRSLRSLAGEKVPTDYCDELDCNTCRFDDLIKKHCIDPEEYCERGLESYLSDERRNGINATRKLHKLLVMSEYDRQGTSGTLNFELVRNASLTYSKKSSARARKLALIDQREAQEDNKLNNTNDYDEKQDIEQHKLKSRGDNSMVDEKVNSSSRHRSQRDQECETNTKRLPFFTPENKVLVKGMEKSHPFESIHRDERQSSSASIRETILKQQLIHLLLKQEQEQNQRARSQYHFQRNHLNSILVPAYPPSMVDSLITSLKAQEQKHQEHHRLQLQIQDQCNYQQQVQRLLLLQQHKQQYDAIQRASVAILEQCHR